MRPILNRRNEWNLAVETMGDGDSFEYFGFVLKKHASAAEQECARE
jgi:hypothetical protein